MHGAATIPTVSPINNEPITPCLEPPARLLRNDGIVISNAQVEAMKKGNLPRNFSYAEAVWSRFKIMIRPVQFGGDYERTGNYFQYRSLRNNLVSLFFYAPILFLSIPGFFFLYKTRKSVFCLFTGIVLTYLLLHIFLVPFTIWRYRLPLDPIFIIIGMYGLVNIFFKNSMNFQQD